MLIAQISDTHLGFVPDDPDEMNARRLRAVLDHLFVALPRRPDLLLATGDLTERGDQASYRRLRTMLDTVPVPVLCTVGNHDLRANFSAVFDHIPLNEGFVQYVVDTDELRIVMLDSLEEGRHGGAFCETRAAWLAARLAEAPDRPTLIVLHHPPFPTGIPWMTTDPREPWVHRLADTIRGHRQIVGMVCGHIHRAIFGRLEDVTVAVCPSSAPAVALELQPMNPEVMDGRPMVIEAAPACTLHLWDGERLVTHHSRVEPTPLIVKYDEIMQPIVRKVFAERPKP
jgi:Icc protein